MSLPLILGTAQWSGSYGLTSLRVGPISRSAVAETVVAASSSGWIALDTSPAYGDAELIIGGLSTNLAVHSKFDSSLSPESSLERSLSRLGVPELDVMYFHDPRACIENPGLVTEARTLVGAGIRSLGSSVYEENEFDAALSSDGVEVIQVPLNPLDRRFSGHHLESAEATDRRVIARSVFLQGALLRHPAELPARMKHLAPYVSEFQAIASRFGASPAQLVFSWLGTIGPLAGVVIGVDMPSDVQDVTLAAAETCDSRAVDMVMGMKVPSWSEVDPRRWT